MSSYTKKQLADAVKTARMEKGYTQQELSDMTGLSLRSIQRIEKEEVLPRAYTVRILATHLGISEEPAQTEMPLRPFLQQDHVLALPLAANGPMLNKPRRVILTVGIGATLYMGALAFVSQAPRFPETLFEGLLYWMAVTVAYTVVLYRLWR